MRSTLCQVQLSLTSELSSIVCSGDANSQSGGHIYWCFDCVVETVCLDGLIVFEPAHSEVLDRSNVLDVALQLVLRDAVQSRHHSVGVHGKYADTRRLLCSSKVTDSDLITSLSLIFPPFRNIHMKLHLR